MSRVYDAAEPGVISQELLHKLVEEQGPTGEAGRIARKEGIEFNEVVSLRVDFQNIRHIENLWQFTNLRKLQLDNNIIDCIAGLDSLVNLEWLDLSFNNIKKISGLDHLTKLKDLSLAHNLIEHVEGLKSLTQLQVLSLGHNLLADMKETVLYLRQMPKLKSLCLRGNTFSPVLPHKNKVKDPILSEYQFFCIAFLPSMVYLDFELITDDAHEEAVQKFVDEISELEAEERKKDREAESLAELEKTAAAHKAAYVDEISGELLYLALFEEDMEIDRLRYLPEEELRLAAFKQFFLETCQEMLQLGLTEAERRRAEQSSYAQAYRQAVADNQSQSIEFISDYEEQSAKVSSGSCQSAEEGERERERVTELHHSLMQLELQLVDQLEDIFKDFERNYLDMISHLLEGIQAHMTLLRDRENEHYEVVTEIATVLLEQYTKGQLEEELPDPLKILFVDKDTLLGAINSSHDAHMVAIDNKEDSIRNRAQRDCKALLDRLQKKELERDRERVTEISNYTDLRREEVEDWIARMSTVAEN